jgi:hypothetical protein
VINIGGPNVGAASLSPSTTNGAANTATDPNGVRVSATGDASAAGRTVVAMAYSIDGGAAVAFPAFAAAPVVAGTAVIPWTAVNALADGPHTVSITATDDATVTSGTPATATLIVDRTGPAASGLSVSPNPTNGKTGDAVDPTSIKVSGSFTDALSNVVAAEGFLQPATAAGAPDTTRTCGSATFACTPGTGFVFVATDGIFNATTEAAYGTFPLSQLVGYKDGTFTVWVHGKDAAGNWTQLTPTTFVVDTSAPTAGAVLAQAVTAQNTLATPTLTVTATDVGTPPSAVTAAEWFEGADPGVGLATPVAIGSAVPVQLASGRFHTVSVRVKDAAGNWSAVANSNALYVDPIFADSFGTFAGSGAAWTGAAAVGGVTFPAAPTGMNGRAMLTGNGTATSNVTTPVLAGAANPAAATYNARFLFENNGAGGANPLLTSAAGWVNIASLRQGGTDVVDVQYNRGSAAAAASLRLRYRTSTGAYVTTAAATPLAGSVGLGTNGVVHTIRVGWTSGATGTVTLRVDAGTVLTVNANTGTNTRVDRTVLGLVNGTANGAGGFSSGRAYFDNFEARRNSQP